MAEVDEQRLVTEAGPGLHHHRQYPLMVDAFTPAEV
jgi:hypothetical protein